MSETVEETIQNDAHHAKLRIQLVLETGMLPEVRAIVEPLFVERRALKRRIKKLAGFDPRNN